MGRGLIGKLLGAFQASHLGVLYGVPFKVRRTDKQNCAVSEHGDEVLSYR